MCLGVPGRVVERQDSADELAYAVVEFAGIRRKVCIACVPDSQPGEYVIVHAGIAIGRIDPSEAERVFAYLRESGDGDGWDEGSNGAGEIHREIP
jgi:hydrogenase expression/formation protein HypC